MREILRKTALLVALLLITPALAPAAQAQSSVAATVNDQPITNYDVSQRVKLLQLFRQKTSQKQALEDLIDDALVDQASKRRNLSIPDAQVTERFNAIAKQVKLSPAEFSKALKQAGVEPDTLRKLLRAQMMFGQVVRAKARQVTSDVTEGEIQAEMQKEGLDTQVATMKEYRLQQIVFVIPRGAQGQTGQRQRDAETFRKRFTGCDNSIALAQSMKGVVVLDAGRRDTSQIDGDFAEALAKVPAGGTMKPEVTNRGVEVIAVCSIKEVQSSAGVRAQIEKKLTEEQTKDIDKTVKAELRKGANIVYN